MIIYDWTAFRLEFEPAKGEAFTYYVDGACSGCGVVEGDRWHAARLGIRPSEHRLLHELAHHLVGIHVYGSERGSPVIWRDAHHLPQESGGWAKPDWTEAAREEWIVTGLTYFTLDQEPPDWGAILELGAAGVNVHRLRDQVEHLLDAADRHPEGLTITIPSLQLKEVA